MLCILGVGVGAGVARKFRKSPLRITMGLKGREIKWTRMSP